MTSRPVVLAAIIGAHGIGGEVRLKLFTETVDGFGRFPFYMAGERRLTLAALKQSGKGIVARFDGIADRATAEGLRGTLLTVPREMLVPLAEGEYYWHDLVGRAVVLPDGTRAGEVVAVDNFGASDIIEIERTDGRRVMVPLTPAAVPEIGDPLRIAPEWLEG